MRLVHPLLSFLGCLGLLCGGLFTTSCTVKTGAGISKVNPYHLERGYNPRTDEEMIAFEHRRKFHGALDSADRAERYGNYYTVYWKPVDRTTPAVVQLHYRQANSGPKVFLQEQEIASPQRFNTTDFKVIGEDYSEGGAVTQWKATVLQSGEIVDEFKSYLWQ